MQWLARYERSRLHRFVMLIVVQMLAIVMVSFSMFIVIVLVTAGDWHYEVSVQDLQIMQVGTPVLWLLMLLTIHFFSLRLAMQHYGDCLRFASPLRLVLGEELLTGGGGGSFRKLLQQAMRRLPRLLREESFDFLEQTKSLQLLYLSGCVLILAWCTYLHLRMGIALEYLMLGGLMLIMLLNYRTALGRLLLELAFCRFLLDGIPVGNEDQVTEES